MQDELDADAPMREIHILGIDAIGLESGNSAITSGRDLPWMQATQEVDPWTTWGVTFRDVIIIGPGNERIGVFNLTEHNLADAASYAALRDMLLQNANQ